MTRSEPSAARLVRSRTSEFSPMFFFCRATAFGILNGLCKFGAILGNTIFASFVGITKVVPILLAAASLVGGGLIALRLPETREQVLMWTAPWEKDGKIFSRTPQHSHTSRLSLSMHIMDSAGGEMDFVIPSLGPTAVVNTCLTQVID